MRSIFFVIQILFTIAVTAQIDNNNFTTYRDDANKFVCWYPNDWKMVPVTHADTRFKATSADGMLDYNIVVQHNEALESMSAKEYADAIINYGVSELEKSLKISVENLEIISFERSKLSSQDATKLIYNFEVSYLDIIIPMKAISLQTLKNGNVYILTYRADSDYFDSSILTFYTIVHGFILQ